MKKTVMIFLTLSTLILTGCGNADPEKTEKDKEIREKGLAFQKVCLEGVSYWVGRAYKRAALAPVYQRDGSFETCDLTNSK